MRVRNFIAAQTRDTCVRHIIGSDENTEPTRHSTSKQTVIINNNNDNNNNNYWRKFNIVISRYDNNNRIVICNQSVARDTSRAPSAPHLPLQVYAAYTIILCTYLCVPILCLRFVDLCNEEYQYNNMISTFTYIIIL